MAAKVLILGAMCRGGGGGGSNRSWRSWGWQATVVAVSRLIQLLSSRKGWQPAVGRDILVW